MPLTWASKISLLVYEWPLIKCKIWYMNGAIFKIWPNLSQNWLKFKKIWGRLVYEWVTFSWKTGICMGLLSNSVAAHPYQNQIWVPPRGLLTICIYIHFHFVNIKSQLTVMHGWQFQRKLQSWHKLKLWVNINICDFITAFWRVSNIGMDNYSNNSAEEVW